MFEFLSKFEFLNRIFHREETRKSARDRLRLVIIQDRASMAPQMLENIKEDLIAVFSKYMEIDVKSVEIGLERKDGTVALAANIPILRIRSVQQGVPLAPLEARDESVSGAQEKPEAPGALEAGEAAGGGEPQSVEPARAAPAPAGHRREQPAARRRRSRVLHKRTKSAKHRR